MTGIANKITGEQIIMQDYIPKPVDTDDIELGKELEDLVEADVLSVWN